MTSSPERVMIVVGAPPENVTAVLDAISGAGGGIVGDYTHCAFANPGEGRFKPSAEAHPHVGDRETINRVPEVRIETFCERRLAKQVAQAIRAAHPYEEPVIYIVPLLSEDDL
ncbi:hypothetical protein G4Y79_24030 [Phototrophicus methaneseepsis]|uniref:Bsu YqfO NIF3/CutA domain n=1 Tax=Phototrophicus methaneseepsis TaxID=2710758 RepID=A0A7S8E989_9CHLR|nr:hypothetical protein [Phototrophicus methaneseepsis]QPC82716.1 hypothetical protein G4Y79_24030 [Phototrophicus methaneseepsis]